MTYNKVNEIGLVNVQSLIIVKAVSHTWVEIRRDTRFGLQTFDRGDVGKLLRFAQCSPVG
jgi:hypothetical protein